MKLKSLLLAALISMPTLAANTYTSGNTIQKIGAYSQEESIYPNWRTIIQVTTNGSMQWSGGGCDAQHVVIRSSDKYLVEFALAAKTQDKTVIFGADTSVPKLDGKYCFARYVGFE